MSKRNKHIIGRYLITYHNGISQEKTLIDHHDYEYLIKPALKTAYEFELRKNDKCSKFIKNQIQEMYGEHWFTNKSPLFEAIKTGTLSLLPQQGGDHPVSFKKLKK